MKRAIIATVLAAVCCCNINAQETMAPAVPAADSNSVAVPSKLQEMAYITDTRPAADAQFYVYLSSASWCPPCRAIMPKIVAEYPAIKAAGGEIILLCCDRTVEAGRGYLKKYDAKFPAVMADIRSMGADGLPGLQVPRGIPAVSIVAPNGKTIHAGHAATLLNWKTIIKK